MPQNTESKKGAVGDTTLIDRLIPLYSWISTGYLKALPLLQGNKIYLDTNF